MSINYPLLKKKLIVFFELSNYIYIYEADDIAFQKNDNSFYLKYFSFKCHIWKKDVEIKGITFYFVFIYAYYYQF